MLKVGTVFSGIGAIEHALQRMGIEHSIEFACDNGDIDIMSKKIDSDIDSIIEEMDFLNQEDLEDDIYDSDKIKSHFNEVINKIRKSLVDTKNIDRLKNEYIQTGLANDNQRKAYKDFENKLNYTENNISKKFILMQLSIKLEGDIKRSSLENDKKEKMLFQFTNNTSYRKIVREIKNISSNLSMSHEKINSERIREKVFALDSLEQQKEYVDNLYVDHLNRNNVRKAYLANYDIDESKYHWNVSFFDGTHFKNKIDLFVGGSPCQSFSLVGKQRGLDDTRGTLFYEYARLVQEIQPKVFIYENVRAVLSNDEGRTWETMSQVFDDLGYKWKYQILNAKDYGIPQNREIVCYWIQKRFEYN